jgi:hypothetical protein
MTLAPDCGNAIKFSTVALADLVCTAVKPNTPTRARVIHFLFRRPAGINERRRPPAGLSFPGTGALSAP